MSNQIYINIVVEDILSEHCLRKIIESTQKHLKISSCYGRNGKGYI